MKVNLLGKIRMVEKEELRKFLDMHIHKIVESESVNSIISETNASDWGVDEFEIEDIEKTDENIFLDITFHVSGQQQEDKMCLGNAISGHAKCTISSDDKVVFDDIETEIDKED